MADADVGAASVRRRKTASASSNGTSTRKEQDAEPPVRSLPFTIGKWLLVILLTAFGVGQFIAGDVLWGYRGKYTKVTTYIPPQRVFTPEELWQYNGKDKNKDVYLSIMGNVYNVTKGRWIYGPRGTYRHFAGRDASRAFVTGCFQTHLTHDLRGLTQTEVDAVKDWKQFYDDHRAYNYLGRLQLPYIDPKSPIPEPCQKKEAKKSSEDRPADAQKPV